VLLAIGAYTLTGPALAPAWNALAISLSSGVTEELVFRGVIFRLLWSMLGRWWALGLSSVLFGVAHLANPNPDIMAMLGIIFGAGVPLAALYILTGRLWASIGCHMAWNFSQGYVFGAQVSGTSFGPSLYRAEPVAGVDALWSGGAFGPEAALPTVILAGLAGAALLALAARRRA
jgi:membrane protease YdiL (CAAX protease family)